MTSKHRRPIRLLSRGELAGRMAGSVGVAGLLIAGSLGVGVVGYHAIAGLGWVDALLNASMILTGMGPVAELRTDGAKIFASIYAIFSGIAFVSIVAVLMAPLVHRFLHRFHLEISDHDAERD